MSAPSRPLTDGELRAVLWLVTLASVLCFGAWALAQIIDLIHWLAR